MKIRRMLSLALLTSLALAPLSPALARGHHHHKASSASHKHASSKSHSRKSAHKRRGAIASKAKSTGKIARVRYAYPADFFMWSAPESMQAKVNEMTAAVIKDGFKRGAAGTYSPDQLVQAGVFVDDPLRGGIFERREKVRYIILHSTETGRPADAPRVIKSWNRGMRHPGAQYIVDRDGVIYQTVDPTYGTVHVNVFKTLYGVNNDNSVGIEIVRAGDQTYTTPQLDSVTRLVAYLQSRFSVDDDHIYGHHNVQPSDRLDPVCFDWNNFFLAKGNLLKTQTVALGHKTQPVVLPKNIPTSVCPITHMPTFMQAECGYFMGTDI